MAKVAFVLETDFEDVEFEGPYDGVREAGHDAVIVGTEAGKQLTGKRGDVTVTVEKTPGQVHVDDFDALVVPGGYSPDKLRLNDDIVKFVRGFFEADKPVAAICHAGQLLVEAEVVDGRTITSWPSVRKELTLAGAEWVDQEVVEDGNLISSRKPDDVPAFTKALLARL
ncbi:MAG: type 1 glutamine amidotransferase [Actinobacteria bacterium]|nr:type 1 glutamine amidotransferase [Actinomycetota bacterium]